MLAGDSMRIDVVPEVTFLGKLIERVAEGKIRIPDFQRPFVWKQGDVHMLLDSIMRGIPIGSLLVWDTEADIQVMNRVGAVKFKHHPPEFSSYLLDGQQRLFSLFSALRLPDDASAITDDVDWKIYCNLESKEFLRLPNGGQQPCHFPVSCLLQTAGFLSACRRIEEILDYSQASQLVNMADRLAGAFREYQIPIMHIRDVALDSAVTVFARLNRTGRKISADQLVSTLTYQRDEFNLTHKIDDLKERLDDYGFGNFKRIFLLRSVLAALNHDIYAKDWFALAIKPEIRNKLPKAFDDAKNGLVAAIKFLRDMGIESDRLLPYGLQVVLLGEFFRLRPDPDLESRKRLARWFWVTSFTSWFGGANSTQATRALADIRCLAREKTADFKAIDLDAVAQPFPERFDVRSARVRSFLLYLASLRPKSLLSPSSGLFKIEGGKMNHEVNIDRLLRDKGANAATRISVDHKQLGDLFDSPANRMFANTGRSRTIFEHMQELNDDELTEVLPSHGFHPDSVCWIRKGDVAKCIRSRLTTLIAGEREFMERKGVTPPPDAKPGVIIADSDTMDDE